MSPDQAIQRILELSADAQIERRSASRNSPKFHNLAGAIAAYGKTLALLVALQERDKILPIGTIDAPASEI
jgi:hypothetical protein